MQASKPSPESNWLINASLILLFDNLALTTAGTASSAASTTNHFPYSPY